MTYAAIGNVLNLDHTTVIHSIRRSKHNMERNRIFEHNMAILQRRLVSECRKYIKNDIALLTERRLDDIEALFRPD
jgi:hypothetical protein